MTGPAPDELNAKRNGRPDRQQAGAGGRGRGGCAQVSPPAASHERMCDATPAGSVRLRTHFAFATRDSQVRLAGIFVLRSGRMSDNSTRPQKWRKQAMKTGFAMLVGVGVLSLAVGIGTANAATRHHHRHAVKSHAVQAPAPRVESSNLTTSGNNPAKKYPTRQIGENAVKNGTLAQNGNNPAKRYPTRQIGENAAKTGTLMQNGNNPAKRYKSTTSTTGAAPR